MLLHIPSIMPLEWSDSNMVTAEFVCTAVDGVNTCNGGSLFFPCRLRNLKKKQAGEHKYFTSNI